MHVLEELLDVRTVLGYALSLNTSDKDNSLGDY